MVDLNARLPRAGLLRPAATGNPYWHAVLTTPSSGTAEAVPFSFFRGRTPGSAPTRVQDSFLRPDGREHHPGSQPRSNRIRPQAASKIKSKTGGTRPARRLTFFSAKKVSKNACFYFCHEGLWPFSTSCPDRPPFLRDHKKSIVPGLAALTRASLFGGAPTECPSWHNRSRRGRGGAVWPIERPAARLESLSAGPMSRRSGLSRRCNDPPNPRNSNARRRRRALFCVLFWAGKRGRRRPGAQPRINIHRPQGRKPSKAKPAGRAPPGALLFSARKK
ncbi:hypothetical protein EDC39_11547 [Geothermobacter ehrlichii]|uniref:Uncharacterized protein n=1 Tax=Geothermobacter ehrlichii TaxID=213224 RepID=A0A5D3WGQ1_9BACT|nr:hypothetical protein EDC39_11547 [Geothermobacter ehrlichii]